MKIYLAIPYSGIEEESFKYANEVASKLMADGHIVYSPISHNHPISKAHGLPTTWDFWKEFDTEFIKWCDKVVVIVLPPVKVTTGKWNGNACDGLTLINESKGVQAEIQIAKGLGKEIQFYNYV